MFVEEERLDREHVSFPQRVAALCMLARNNFSQPPLVSYLTRLATAFDRASKPLGLSEPESSPDMRRSGSLNATKSSFGEISKASSRIDADDAVNESLFPEAFTSASPCEDAGPTYYQVDLSIHPKGRGLLLQQVFSRVDTSR